MRVLGQWGIGAVAVAGCALVLTLHTTTDAHAANGQSYERTQTAAHQRAGTMRLSGLLILMIATTAGAAAGISEKLFDDADEEATQ